LSLVALSGSGRPARRGRPIRGHVAGTCGMGCPAAILKSCWRSAASPGSTSAFTV